MPDINIIEITASAGASSIVVDPSGAMLYAAQAAESAATAADLASSIVVDPLAAGTRSYDTAAAVVVAVGTTSSAEAALPTLGETGEVMVHPTVAVTLALGGSDVGAAVIATTPLRVEAGERFHFRPTAAQTHFRVIGEAAGVLRLIPVA